MSRKGERYWFENTLADKPIEGEDKIFNKYKGLVKYAVTKIKRRFDQDGDLICVGNMALLRQIRYNKYKKEETLKKGLCFRDFFMQVIVGAMIRELNKQKPKYGSIQISIEDDFPIGENLSLDNGVVLSNEDAILSLKWRDEKTKETVLKEIKPAIYGNPEKNLIENDLMDKVINIVDFLPEYQKVAVRDYFGLDNGIEMSYVELANKYNIKPPSARERVIKGINMIKKECERLYGDEV